MKNKRRLSLLGEKYINDTQPHKAESNVLGRLGLDALATSGGVGQRTLARVGNFKRSGGWLGRVYKGKTYKKRRHIFLANFSTLTVLLTTRIF